MACALTGHTLMGHTLFLTCSICLAISKLGSNDVCLVRTHLVV